MYRPFYSQRQSWQQLIRRIILTTVSNFDIFFLQFLRLVCEQNFRVALFIMVCKEVQTFDSVSNKTLSITFMSHCLLCCVNAARSGSKLLSL